MPLSDLGYTTKGTPVAINNWDLRNYKALVPWFAALAQRETRRANVVMIGASITEGYGGAHWINNQAVRLASMLRTRFPTTSLGIGGGLGHIGQPAKWPNDWSFGTTGTSPTPTPGYLDELLAIGANHVAGHLPGNGSGTSWPWEKLALPARCTSFDITYAKSVLGAAGGAYYKPDAGAEVAFNTYAATPTATKLHVAQAVITSIEIGSLLGDLYLDGIIHYDGDENCGIQVHNCGHGSYAAAVNAAHPYDIWDYASTSAGAWTDYIKLLQPDLMIISDLGVNDGATTIGNRSAAQFAGDLQLLISHMRSSGITCPIMIAANYDTTGGSGLTFVDPWSDYVDAMQDVVAADPTLAFVNHADRMPPTTSANTSGLYYTDSLHCSADGRGSDLMAATLCRAISPN